MLSQLQRLKGIDWTRTALLVVAILAIASAVYNWYRPAQHVTTQQFVPVPQIKEVVKLKTVTVQGPERIRVIEKEKAVDKLSLTPDIASNPAKQITTTADIPASKGGSSVVSIIDTQTGESTIIAKEKPVPFFGFPNEKEIGARYGVSTATVGGQEGQLYARWTFVRMGAVHLGGYGELNTAPDAKAMLDLSYRF